MEKKRLERSTTNVMVAGVLSGIAEYFEQDATVWRLGFVFFLLLTGVMPGVLMYLIAWILIPEASQVTYRDVTPESDTGE